MRENGAMRLHLLRRSGSLGTRRVPLPVGVRLQGILKRCLMNEEGTAEACPYQFLARPAISTEGHTPPLAVPENQPIRVVAVLHAHGVPFHEASLAEEFAPGRAARLVEMLAMYKLDRADLLKQP